jgi:hypothetical protein
MKLKLYTLVVKVCYSGGFMLVFTVICQINPILSTANLLQLPDDSNGSLFLVPNVI